MDSLVAPATRWRQLVVQYSRLQLSKERDIFPAIQGLAKYFHGEMQCAYYAGLWESSLIEDLLWATTSNLDPRPRAKPWRAPTWSWASTSHISWKTFAGFQALATVVAISTIPVDSDSFGEIRGGELQLRGRCIDSMLMNATGELEYGIVYEFIALKLMNEGREAMLDESSFSLDYEPPLRCEMTLKLMEVGKLPEHSRFSKIHWFIMLQCVDEEQQVYERIGLATVKPGTIERIGLSEILWHFDHSGKEQVLKIV